LAVKKEALRKSTDYVDLGTERLIVETVRHGRTVSLLRFHS